MPKLPRFDPKAPTDVLPYSLNFADPSDRWLAIGDAITGTPTVATDPTDMTVQAVSTDGSMVTAWLSGGTSGTDYVVSYTITTAFGDHATRSANLFCITPR